MLKNKFIQICTLYPTASLEAIQDCFPILDLSSEKQIKEAFENNDSIVELVAIVCNPITPFYILKIIYKYEDYLIQFIKEYIIEHPNWIVNDFS